MTWALIVLLFTGSEAVAKPAQLFSTERACRQALEQTWRASLRQPLLDGQGRVLRCERRL